MKFNPNNLLTYPKQTIDTKSMRWCDVIGWCPFCEMENLISGYSCLGNNLIQECCRTCGKWWNVNQSRLFNITQESKREDKS